MIRETLILLDENYENQRDFFEQISKKLIEEKIVKEGYFEALLKREEEFPTGLPVTPGVAIPHLSSDYSLENRIIYVRLEEPIKFMEMGTDDQYVDVKHVFFLVLKDGHDHIELLSSIIGLIQDASVLDSLNELQDISSAKKYLNIHIGGN